MVTLENFWEDENFKITSSWVAFVIWNLLGKGSEPTAQEMISRFGMDEPVANYVLAYSQGVVDAMRRLDPEITIVPIPPRSGRKTG